MRRLVFCAPLLAGELSAELTEGAERIHAPSARRFAPDTSPVNRGGNQLIGEPAL